MSAALPAFTLFHLALSLAGILAGLLVVFALIFGETVEELDCHVSTNHCGDQPHRILVPIPQVLPSHGVGIVSLLALALTIPALYVFHLAGARRRVYVIGSVMALYLNVFVLIAQYFMNIAALKALAPTGSEPPFLVTQVVVMLIFIVLGGFRDQAISRSTSSRRSALKAGPTCFESCWRIDSLCSIGVVRRSAFLGISNTVSS
jgi:hypothetical protein